jgi:hypothetical protein
MQLREENRKMAGKPESERPINGDIEECEAREASEKNRKMRPAAQHSSRSYQRNSKAIQPSMQIREENRKMAGKPESERPINGDIEECEAKEEKNRTLLPDLAPSV